MMWLGSIEKKQKTLKIKKFVLKAWYKQSAWSHISKVTIEKRHLSILSVEKVKGAPQWEEGYDTEAGEQ